MCNYIYNFTWVFIYIMCSKENNLLIIRIFCEQNAIQNLDLGVIFLSIFYTVN